MDWPSSDSQGCALSGENGKCLEGLPLVNNFVICVVLLLLLLFRVWAWLYNHPQTDGQGTDKTSSRIGTSKFSLS